MIRAFPANSGGIYMATSTCIKCGGRNFELELATPKGAAFKLYFVQCVSCGGVVGVQEFHNIGARIDRVEKALSKIADRLNVPINWDRI